MTRREKLEEMLKSSPDDPFLHYGLAMEHRTAGAMELALAELQKVLELDPDYVAAYFHRGQFLAEQGAVEPARQTLQRGIEVARRTGDEHAAQEMAGFLATLPGH
jgi:tetratricopeptide (TPR) repeat protein